MPDDLQHQIGGMQAHERRDLVFDLHEGLIMVGLQWADIQEPLRAFRIETTCHIDGLTKNELLRLIRTVRDGGILTMEKIARALNHPPPTQPETRPAGFRTPEQ